jgi:hypothetical protein
MTHIVPSIVEHDDTWNLELVYHNGNVIARIGGGIDRYYITVRLYDFLDASDAIWEDHMKAELAGGGENDS